MPSDNTHDPREGARPHTTRVALPPDGYVLHCHQWLPRDEARQAFDTLLTAIAWQQPDISLFGRTVAIPRLQAWIGDPGIEYRYSGTCFSPTPWPALLETLRTRVSTHLQRPFNSVLANLYRNGDDCMHWHADDERELGESPCIASVSLGATRDFRLRPRAGHEAALTLPLADGDLLVMGGDCQRHWQHCLPRRKRVDTPRINLTFRHIVN